MFTRKKSIVFMLLLIIALSLFSGCKSDMKKYSDEFLGAFDTIIQFVGYAENEDTFKEMVAIGRKRFEKLHRLFDIYNEYDGMNNIKTVNDNAGVEPVFVQHELIDILSFSLDWYEKTDGVVNIAFGPVLSIWHQYREEGISDPENAKIPDRSILEQANLKTDIEKIVIDMDRNTVFLKEKGMMLDLGSVAKGYATELVASELAALGYDSFAIYSGGNVRVVGSPKDGRTNWNIGIQDPDGNELVPDRDLLGIAYVSDASVVTSGDYHRYYVVDGERIHHLIDPKTLIPADHYRSVTVVTKDSGVADFLSTALFLLPYEQSRSIAEGLDGVDALWVLPDGQIKATPAMEEMLHLR